MAPPDVPDIVIGRLPFYLRALSQIAAMKKEVISSQDLGARLGISPAQIRKDLSQFGEFGKQGTGYNTAFLMTKLREILHVDRVWDVALVGVGDLGRAVAHYGGFLERGFRISALFDNDPAKIGTGVAGLVIQDTDHLVEGIRSLGIHVAMLAVPAAEAQPITDALVQAGIQAILCYAPTTILVPEGVRVQYIDPVVHLQRMTYYQD